MRISRVTPVFALALCGCSWFGGTSSPLPSDEVLQRTARASQDLQSANYTLDGNYSAESVASWNSEGEVHLEGTLQDSGQQNQFQLSLKGDYDRDNESYTLDGTLEVIVAGVTSYMKLHSLNVQPSTGLFRPDLVGQFAGKWWQLPQSPETGESTPGLGPDPQIMQAQSQVVTVTEDHGLVPYGEGQAYRYSVKVDPEKLVQYFAALAEARGEEFDEDAIRTQLSGLNATGELWIDSETFHLVRVSWVISEFPVQGYGMWTANFEITFRNFNDAEPIEIPTDAVELSPGAFLSVPPPVLPDQALPGVSPELEQQMLQELMNNMNQ